MEKEQDLFESIKRRNGAGSIGAVGDKLTFCNADAELKRVGGDTKPPEGSIMVFDAVITSKRQDRDGDILESKGAKIDPAAPLLWQHDANKPVGRLLQVTEQNESRVKGRFAIASTPLGRDAATLLSFGALRISHGFRPTKFEPIRDDGGEQTGWRIKEFEVMEISLVSVPSNVDAVITAHEAGKFCSPQVKQWAGTLADARKAATPAVVAPVAAGDAQKAGADLRAKLAARIRAKLRERLRAA